MWICRVFGLVLPVNSAFSTVSGREGWEIYRFIAFVAFIAWLYRISSRLRGGLASRASFSAALRMRSVA